jgi:hypothetical protein
MIKKLLALTPQQMANLTPKQLAEVERVRAYAREKGIQV